MNTYSMLDVGIHPVWRWSFVSSTVETAMICIVRPGTGLWRPPKQAFKSLR